MFFKTHLTQQDCPQLTDAVKDVYQFLKWKLSSHPEKFTTNDIQIIESRLYSDFFKLSSAASYNKIDMTLYTEHLWQLTLRNSFMLEGYTAVPRPCCTKLQLQIGIRRDTEVLLMSMFYDNNLLYSSLFKVNSKKFQTADCECNQSIQDPYHVLLECSFTEPKLRESCLSVMSSILPLRS